MAKSVHRRAPALPKTRFRPFEEIGDDLNRIKCTLSCAASALDQAQNQGEGAGSLAVQSSIVISNCVRDLARFEDELDSWYVSHEHSAKGVARG